MTQFEQFYARFKADLLKFIDGKTGTIEVPLTTNELRLPAQFRDEVVEKLRTDLLL